MPDDDKSDPIEDVRKGLGLLFRAARTSLEKFPKKDLEEAVVTSAREVGRAFENVGRTIEREVFGKTDAPTKPADPPGVDPPPPEPAHEDEPPEPGP